jgi:hypothetical protein
VSHAASQDLRTTHPLAGLESWPKTGPVYGLAEDDETPRATTFWARIGERFRKSPQGENFNPGQARIWY